MQELVSIIVPIYNTEKHLAVCINSLIKQTYRRIEIILVDDGSVDRSGAIADEFAAIDSRIKVIHKSNNGVSDARNTGIEASQGSYLTFVDADDYVSLKFIEEAVCLCEKYQLDIIQGNTIYFYSENLEDNTIHIEKVGDKSPILIRDIKIVKNKVLGNGKEKNNPLKNVFTSGSVCKLFRRDVIGSVRFSTLLSIGEDTVFNLNVLDNTNKFGYIPYVWYFYRRNPNSATSNYSLHKIEMITALVDYLSKMESINSEYYRPYLRERTLQQFYGVLVTVINCSPEELESRSRADAVNRIINDQVWNRLLLNFGNERLPGNIFDRMLQFFCRIHAIHLILLLTKIRTKLAAIKEKR